ncbi:MAG: DUF1176 domain-containing protein [Sphingobium sp.]|uniref:DUF1176 domain-containing protein n=1 Tax=Sphingobium TaxID=165695 RepID=UPI00037CDDC0|nr:MULTISPECIES: DUF1176 domain-containing protein [Sphingobium]MBU0657232.1 DUF1176 domain-containing protein [Alphaproteobacteria bacterium]MBA4753539.1 DUF1176 domain-containing protein [Sphingobium sp.]MBS88924.1 DUF1176 domain-containing protein [Sphingobium sp.]MBU0868123.1 DUF1176 domain-containing protein [Alphaproteobacteria bacterium]MBU1795612.1 DUF1176 domain-containing protein [Alphaproteobacteria bacterium]
MGAKTVFAAALAVSLGSPMAVAQAPKPGRLETYKDWTIGCDNRNRCEAVSLLPEGGDLPDIPLMIGIVRAAGPDAQTEVWISREGKGQADVTLSVDGRKIASAIARDGEATIRGPQASALAIAMARGTSMEVRAGARLLGRPSLAGSGAALRYMDARQGRAGTTTALVATGTLGPTAVKPAPVAPAIRRALVPAGPAPAALWREELTALGKYTGCTDDMRSDQTPDLQRLSKTETLILVPCGSGAYNFSSVPVIATGVPGRRSFRFAAFDFKPGWSEEAGHPMLVNVGWSPEKSRLDSFAKGRGLGDCGGSEAYVWDGQRFRLIEATSMGECRGAWHWITTWTARVVE